MAERKASTGAADALPSRRSMFTNLAGAVAALSVPGAAVAFLEPDPVFGAIERHRAAYEAFGAVLKADNDWNRPEADAASAANTDAEDEFLATEPTTPAGLLAMMEHCAEHLDYGDSEILEYTFPTMLQAVATFLAGAGGAA